MNILSLNKNNIANEHICCSITDKKGENCVALKKEWLKERFEDGLVFKKINVRGKVFIEYIPAEKAWAPIIAKGYIYINCFWVSGKFKGQDYANILLDQCISDAKLKGKKGIVVLSSKAKKPFLSDPKYLKYKDFKICDTAEPYYELLYLPFDEKSEKPRFKDCAKEGKIDEKGIVLYYSDQCPHTEKYGIYIQKIAKERGIDFKLIKYHTTEQAQNASAPFTTYSLFYNGKFVTNEILSEKKFIKFIDEKGI